VLGWFAPVWLVVDPPPQEREFPVLRASPPAPVIRVYPAKTVLNFEF
jgi:hypothetical protein